MSELHVLLGFKNASGESDCASAPAVHWEQEEAVIVSTWQPGSGKVCSYRTPPPQQGHTEPQLLTLPVLARSREVVRQRSSAMLTR